MAAKHAFQSWVGKMTRVGKICYLSSDRVSCTQAHKYVCIIYIFSILSACSLYKLEVVLSKIGHWFIFVYCRLTCVEILSCSALAAIRNSLKQDLT